MASVQISSRSTVRGADGRLYAVTANGVVEVGESQNSTPRAVLRAGERASFDATDLESGRMYITPGA